MELAVHELPVGLHGTLQCVVFTFCFVALFLQVYQQAVHFMQHCASLVHFDLRLNAVFAHFKHLTKIRIINPLGTLVERLVMHVVTGIFLENALVRVRVTHGNHVERILRQNRQRRRGGISVRYRLLEAALPAACFRGRRSALTVPCSSICTPEWSISTLFIDVPEGCDRFLFEARSHECLPKVGGRRYLLLVPSFFLQPLANRVVLGPEGLQLGIRDGQLRPYLLDILSVLSQDLAVLDAL
mmetsp:Transcript_19790/g.52962  ORF Transcript_19790/g.52962 Transcript_19790/m.52962 type:complete len:242 (+) Transcript_19790:953-1678(+)